MLGMCSHATMSFYHMHAGGGAEIHLFKVIPTLKNIFRLYQGLF